MTNVSTSGKTIPPFCPPSAPTALPQKPSVVPAGKSAPHPFALLKKTIMFQTWTIAFLVVVVLTLLPFAKTVDFYFAMNPERKIRPLSALMMPNMTDKAILAWSTTSITEIMTMGFGDIDIRIPKQKGKFTSGGWASFMKSFEGLKIKEAFKQSQLVLTTVPSNTPIILVQGVNLDNVYQWTVQMPIIMTYATNNNVTRKQNSTVTLTIVRAPTDEYASGIAIKNWRLN